MLVVQFSIDVDRKYAILPRMLDEAKAAHRSGWRCSRLSRKCTLRESSRDAAKKLLGLIGELPCEGLAAMRPASSARCCALPRCFFLSVLVALGMQAGDGRLRDGVPERAEGLQFPPPDSRSGAFVPFLAGGGCAAVSDHKAGQNPIHQLVPRKNSISRIHNAPCHTF